jgi:hypothetical protein
LAGGGATAIFKMDSVNLWDLFVVYLFGGYWMSILGLALLIFVILAIMGRMSRVSTIYYLMFFMMTMALGWGLKILTVFIGIAIMTFLYFSFESWVNNR